MTDTVRVRHIGVKAKRADTMTGTGTVWYGYGDIQTVPAKDWETLKRHPDLWELVTGEDPPTEAPPQAATEAAMAQAEVFAQTRAAGLLPKKAKTKG